MCLGCIGRGTGTNCCMCTLPIPADKQRTPDSPSELNATSERD